MEISSILRAIVLCLLGSGFHYQVARCRRIFTAADFGDLYTALPVPSTLKDILDLLGKLGTLNSRYRVADTLNWRIQEYILGRGTGGSSLKRNLEDIITRVAGLRNVLLKDPNNYGKYSDYYFNGNPIEDFANAFAHWLPILHSEFWFVYYHTGFHCKHLGGAGWMDQQFGESHQSTQLHQWLTDKLTKYPVPTIPKGFKDDDLRNGLAAEIAANTWMPFDTGNALNHAQYGLFFLSPSWNDSNLASAILFLQEFCRATHERRFGYYISWEKCDKVKSVCNAFSGSLATLSNAIYPLYSNSANLYNYLLNTSHFDKYYYWLEKNISNLYRSLGRMSKESKNWTHEMLFNAKSPGPFKYGFVFKWQWENALQSQFPNALESLTQSKSATLSTLGQDPTQFEESDEEEEYEEEKVDTDTLEEASAGESEGEPDVADTEEEQSEKENTDAETLDNTSEESDAEEEPETVQSQSFSDYPTNEYSGIALSSPLKDILDLLGTLYQSGVEFQLLDTIHQKIEAYLQPTGIPGESVKKNVDKALERIAKLRKMLLKNPDDYGEYSNYKPSEGSLDKYANFLAQWLPILHSELYDFYYQSGLQCVHMKDGSLITHTLGKSRFHSLVHKWFTDNLDTTTVPCIDGQYRDDDSHKNTHGSHIVDRTSTSLSGGRLSYAQYGLLFLSPTWHDSNLGSAVLFVQEFCSEVNGDKFDNYLSGNKYGGLKSVCSQLSGGLTYLIDTINPLYDGSSAMYKGQLRPEAFPSYVDWLGKNLDGLVKSLNTMSTDSKHWKATPLEEGLSVGPFPYGFVFKDTNWNDSIRAKLVEYIQVLTNSGTGALTRLSAALTKSMSETSGDL